mmetsp:Transcript_31098/g.47492  ORF Transcript_31098/g.47492 Transcript_31098/m.47492 type:complete len:116 (-) Transcript_31098:412-759(-)
MNKIRVLVFEVMFLFVEGINVKGVGANFGSNLKDAGKKQGITLDSCFSAFSKEELLSGSDQWYCNKCQEHRDIHKKLELFKIPEILMIQIKRFTSKKSAKSGKSGFFNLAYAQIC